MKSKNTGMGLENHRTLGKSFSVKSVLIGLLAFTLSAAMPAHASIPKPSRSQIISVTEQWRTRENFATNFASRFADVEICRKAALAGNPIAQYNLALRYEAGFGVQKNLEEAIKWYQKAADQGVPIAEYALGTLTVLGLANKPDLPAAASLLRRAAEHDFVSAQYALADCLEYGVGVETNIAEAIEWYQKAASNGYAPAQYSLGMLYSQGVGLPHDAKEAFRFFRLAAEQNHVLAQHDLGICYSQGIGVDQNFPKAVKWFRLAAERGFAWSQHDLGNCYSDGLGVETNLIEAARWFRHAAEQGNSESQYAYGLCWLCGDGVVQDFKEAANWLRKAVEQDNPKAKAALGSMYLHGEGVETNLDLGVKLIHAAAEAGAVWGLRFCAEMYATGLGVKPDKAEAYKWYTLAIQQGNAEAQASREQLAASMTSDQIIEGRKRANLAGPITPIGILPMTPNPMAVTARIIAHGIFESPKNKLTVKAIDDPTGTHQFVASTPEVKVQTNSVPAKLGVAFGILCDITGLALKTGDKVALQTIWKYPTMAKPDGSQSEGFSFVETRKIDVDGHAACFVGYVFEEQYELVPGVWRLELRFDGTPLTSQEFVVFRE